LGVCGGYNLAAELATKDWVLGANDHNELVDGSIDSFRSYAAACPTARVMFGHISGWRRLGWIHGGGYIQPGQLPPIWAAEGWRTHGAAAFIRRDSWGAGYRPQLGYMADHEQTMTLAFRHGCVDIPAVISRVDFRPDGYSQAHGDLAERNRILAEWRKLIDTPEFADVREAYLLFDKITGHFAQKES
jgi:hypothetical protein